jgi:hypothetical protein
VFRFRVALGTPLPRTSIPASLHAAFLPQNQVNGYWMHVLQGKKAIVRFLTGAKIAKGRASSVV